MSLKFYRDEKIDMSLPHVPQTGANLKLYSTKNTLFVLFGLTYLTGPDLHCFDFCVVFV